MSDTDKTSHVMGAFQHVPGCKAPDYGACTCIELFEQQAAQLAEAQALVRDLAAAAVEMCGYVRSFALSDEGAGSEWDRWRACRDKIAALARVGTDAPKEKA